MSRPLRQKPCQVCNHLALVLYRVQYEQFGAWKFVCPDCWTVVSKNNPFYIYGGTWKAKKKES